MADSNSSTSTTTGGSNGAGAHIHHHHTHSVPHHHHHHHHSVNHHNSHGTSNSTSAGAGKRQSSDAKTGGGSVGAGKIIHRTTSESLRLGGNGTATNDVGHAAASTNSSNSTSSSTSPATATAAGGGGGGNSRKAKTSSFQITSVTVGTRNVGPDNGEDSADDLDESHTDDNSRITDLENETPSFSEDTFSKEDLFIARDALGTAPVIPTSSQYGLAIVAPGELTNMPGGVGGGGGNGSPQGGKDSDAQLHANADLKQHEVDLKDMNHRNERFKVVKIESTEPFKRGRWMCMDYLDHTTLQTNNVNNATNKEGENGGGGGTGDSGVGLNENHVDQTEMTDESPNQQPHSQFLGSSGTGTGSTFAAISSTSTSPAQSISTTVEAATFMHGQTMSIPVTSTAVDSSATGSPAVAQSLPPQQLQQILSQQTNNSNSGILPGTPVSQSQFYPAASSVATAAEATSTQPVFSAAVAATMNQHSGQGHTLPAGLPSSVLQQPANNATNVPQQPMTIGHVDATLLMTNVGGGNPTTDAGQNQFIGESGSAPSNLAPNTDAVAPATTPVFAGVVNTTTATGGTDSGSSTTPVQEVNAAVLAATLQTSSPGSGTPSQTAPSSSSLMSRGAAAAAAAAALGGDQILNVAAAIIGEDAQSVGEDSESASGTSVAIDNKIEQAMDLVKSHLMFAVREEVEVLKERIAELMDRINQLEVENSILKANASQETLAQLAALSASAPKPAPNPNAVNPPAP